MFDASLAGVSHPHTPVEFSLQNEVDDKNWGAA
jgi:hypothetical protein